MSRTSSLLKLLLLVIVIVALFFGYRAWRSGQEPAADLLGVEAVGYLDGTAAAGGTDEFLSLLLSLQNISLESEIYPQLRTFKDFSTELKPQTPGRPNPFAPIGKDAARPATSSPAAATSSAGSRSAAPAAPAAPRSAVQDLFDFLNN